MNFKAFGLLIIALLTISTVSVKAQLFNFDFSFSSDPRFTGSNGDIDGTVTGELVGLKNNATSLPSDIIITSAPPDLGIPSLYDFLSAGFQATGDGFTVNNGVMQSGDLEIGSSNPGLGASTYSYLLLLNYLPQDANNHLVSFISYPGASEVVTGVQNVGGFSGVTYSYVGLTAPEPSDYVLLLLGGVALLVGGKRLCR